jgi:hypothetical protein
MCRVWEVINKVVHSRDEGRIDVRVGLMCESGGCDSEERIDVEGVVGGEER